VEVKTLGNLLEIVEQTAVEFDAEVVSYSR
jgi:hypothetical protein